MPRSRSKRVAHPFEGLRHDGDRLWLECLPRKNGVMECCSLPVAGASARGLSATDARRAEPRPVMLRAYA